MVSRADYGDAGDKIYRLFRKKTKTPVGKSQDEPKKRISDMDAFLKEQSNALTEYHERLARLIEKVVLRDKVAVDSPT